MVKSEIVYQNSYIGNLGGFGIQGLYTGHYRFHYYMHEWVSARKRFVPAQFFEKLIE